MLTAGGDILTNWHVVRGFEQVGVIFKPPVEGNVPTKADIHRGHVIKIDEVADLALVHVDEVPSGVVPLSLGVNSFKSQCEGLNFAVDEVHKFLAEPIGRVAANAPARKSSPVSDSCQPKELFTSRNKAGDGTIISYDLDCDGKPDMEIRIPDSAKEPISAVFDRKKTGKIDLIVFDGNRDTKWDFSLHDTKANGHWDLIGVHSDGTLVASRLMAYTPEALARVINDPATYKH